MNNYRLRIVIINKYNIYKQASPITAMTMTSDILSKVLPIRSNITKSYSPFNEFMKQETPKPRRKFINWPEKIPETAVESYPFFAKVVIDR